MNKDNRVLAQTVLGVFSTLAFLLLGADFLRGRIPVGSELYYRYFGYSLSAVIFFHVIFFGINSLLQGNKHRKRIPKYLEYAYAIIISMGLAQVFFSAPRIATYIKFISGTEEELSGKIVEAAREHVKTKCVNPDKFLTLEYCTKLRHLADAPVAIDYVLKNVLSDDAFLNQVHGYFSTKGGSVAIVSPIKMYANQLRAQLEYGQLSNSDATPNIFAWLALLLLPIGISLRLVKTSLELFGNLDDKDAGKTNTTLTELS